MALVESRVESPFRPLKVPKRKDNKVLASTPVKVTDKKNKMRRKEEDSAGERVQSVEPKGGCLEGMSAAELTMVRRLAGNDSVIRKKTFKKLKKWLNVLAQKVPDSPECRGMIEPNFIRVWKALFYCMWMADKPMPQEQLADSISDLQKIFASNTHAFLLFVEWFLRTVAREWSWIDRFRMDKFMMMFRRFLRKTLFVISEKKWQNDILEGFLLTVSTHIFNRHPTTKSKKQKQGPKQVPLGSTPLGLQIHFTDIFMEELAKVGGEQLKFQKTLKILNIFMHELGYNSDDRLLGEIRERIFNHLMNQSDVAMDYHESLENRGLELEVTEDEELETNEEEEDEEVDEVFEGVEDDEDEISRSSGILDPRAGGIDVILPQLDVDYEKMYQKLIEFGGQKELKLKNRRILYSIASQFREITEGKYPFAISEENERQPAIPRKEINKAAKRLLETEQGEVTGKRRKTKKERKRDAKRNLGLSQQSLESVGSEDESQYIQDEDILNHVTDNYMSYLEDEVESKTDEADIADGKQKTRAKTSKTEPKASQADKPRKRKYKTVVEVEAEEDDSNLPESNNTNSNDENVEDMEEEIIIKRPKVRRSGSLGNTATPLKGKKVRRVSELASTPTANRNSSLLNNSLTNSASKRVSFVLAKNLEHAHADYPESIARSPAIPFNKDKHPAYGLLKSPATPSGTPLSALSKRRASAIDFFDL